MNWVFILYGAVIIGIDAFAIWKPRVWVEWTERQFIYWRERVGAGAFFILLGIIPIYWILSLTGWQFYILSVLSGIWIVLGALILSFPDVLRNMLLALGGLDDKVLRWLFVADAAVGVLLVLIGVLT